MHFGNLYHVNFSQLCKNKTLFCFFGRKNMDTGFNEEQLRFDLIEVTGTELKKVASDTSKKIS
jgi:2-iminoacetate synthase ThiH